MKSEGNSQFSGTESQTGMISLREVASINEETINPKSLDWLNYTDIASVGTRTVEFPQTITGQNAPSRARRVLRNGDTVLSTVRPNRKSYFQFKDNWDRAIASTGFAVVSPKNLQDADYLYAVLTSDASTLHYESLCEGGAYPAFNPRTIEEMQIPWPSKEERNVVGGLSASILKKIETNGQLARTLEDIAQTIFKSWFIDFDPVKAKMAGEKPVSMDDATAALFPDSMENSELGPIPKGWKYGTLGDVCLILDSRRVPLSGAERKRRPGSIPYYGATGILDFVDNHLFEGPHILVGEDGSVTTKEGTPYVQYVWGKFWVSNHAHVLQGVGGFSVEQLKLFLDRVQISNYVTGAVQPKLNQANLKSVPCLVPQVQISDSFNLIIGPMFEKIRLLSEQTNLLAETRDRLLPRLISGELQIPEEMLVS